MFPHVFPSKDVVLFCPHSILYWLLFSSSNKLSTTFFPFSHWVTCRLLFPSLVSTLALLVHFYFPSFCDYFKLILTPEDLNLRTTDEKAFTLLILCLCYLSQFNLLYFQPRTCTFYDFIFYYSWLVFHHVY